MLGKANVSTHKYTFIGNINIHIILIYIANSKSKSKTHLLTINEDIIMQALADTRPLGVKTSDGDSQQTITDVSDTWNAIGGLEDVKEQLLELVKWPSLVNLVIAFTYI